MSLTKDDVKKIAHLARLNLPDEDIPQTTQELTAILNFIAHMNQQDTDHIEPLAHPLDLSQRLREDKVTEPNLRKKYQSIAPQVEAGLYLVPQVIEEAE